jgi:PAS domain S-box-containing protein
MGKKPTYEELEKRVEELEKVADERRWRSRVFQVSDQEKEVILNSLMEHVIHLDNEMRILWANRAACESANLSYEEIEGRYCYEIWPKSDPCSDCPVIRAMETGQPQVIEKSTPDGRYWLIRGYPFRDRNGDIVGGIEVTLEITEQKQAEEAIRESEHRYFALVQESPDAIISLDKTGNFLSFNTAAERKSGFSAEEVIGKHFAKIGVLAKQSIPKALKEFALVATGAKRPPFELTIMRKDKSYLFMEANPRLIKHKREKAWLQVTFRDITDRKLAEGEKKKLEAQLQQAQKIESIGTLAGGIAHDFNNILSSVIGFTELALEDTEEGTLQHTNLKEVLIAGNRAKDLVNQILTFARRSDEEVKPTKFSTIAKETLKLIRSTIPASIEIKQNIDSDSLIMVNPTLVQQIFMNLFTNANHAMEDEGGVLEVNLADVKLDSAFTRLHKGLIPGDYLKLSVSDTGTGISPNIIEFIFEPYFTTKGPGEGTGMGLAMVHGIVKGYGGEITVESKMGKGTVFTVYLPITQKSIDKKPYPVEEAPFGTEQILFVDDELPIVKMNKQALESLGHKVTTRTSSIEALELFRSKPNDFDIVITDMTMPNMNGDQLAGELIKIRTDIPIILSTGYSKKISDERAAMIGIKAFAMKPISKIELAKTIRKVLDKPKV